MPKMAWADYELAALDTQQTTEQVRARHAKRRVRQRRFGSKSAGQATTNDGSNATIDAKRELMMESKSSASNLQESMNKNVYSYNGEHPGVEGQTQMASSNPLALADDQELCNKVIHHLEEGEKIEKRTLLSWFHKETRKLALSRSGCRVVQKALEVTGGSDRDLIIAELKEHVVELYESPNGNHVLSRAIEVLPASKNGFIISALLGRGLAVSKHRFGCRVVCRLIEHCAEEQIGSLLDEVLAEALPLSRHMYGNFVIQTALEHTSHARRSAVLTQLLPEFSSLTTHRTGSLVAQRVFDYCDAQGQDLALRVLLHAEGENSVVEVACSHYGSYVLEQVAGLHSMHHAAQEIGYVLGSNLHRLCASQHAQRVAIAFGLATPEQLEQRATETL